MSNAKDAGLGSSLKTDGGQGFNVIDLAAAIRRMEDESEKKTPPEPEPEPTTESAEATEKTPDDAAADAAEEKGKDDVLSQDEPEAETSEPTAEPSDRGELEYPKFKKRVDQLTAQKKEAQAKIAELESKLVELQSKPEPATTPAPASTPSNPFQHVQSYAALKAEEANAEQVIEWCDANEDGAVLKQNDGEREYTSQEVRAIRRNAEKALRKDLPAHSEYLRAREHFDHQAVEAYAWWKDKAAGEYQAAAQLLRVFPEMAKFPDYKISVGDFIEGRRARMAKASKPTPAAAPRKAPAQPTAPAAQPAPVEPSAARSDAARKRFAQSGNVDDLAKLIAADL